MTLSIACITGGARRRTPRLLPALIALIPTLALTLAACAPPEVGRALDTAQTRRAEIAGPLTRATLAGNAAPRSALRIVSDRPYVGLVKLRAGHDLPENLRGPHGVTLPPGGYDVPGLARLLTRATGLTVTVAGPPPEGGEAPFALPESGVAGLVASRDWTGPLDLLLDGLADQYGYEWRTQADHLVIVRRKTALIRFAASPLRRPYEGEVSGGAASEGSGGNGDGGASVIDNARQSLKSHGEDYRWEEIKAELETAAGTGDTRITTAPNAGTVTVSGLPRAVERLKAMARAANQRYLRPVDLAVRFVRVDHIRAADYGFDLVFALKDIGRGLGLSFTGGGSGGLLGIVRNAGTAPADSLNTTLRALDTLGTISRNAGFGVSGSNRRPSTFNDLDMQTYVESTSSNVTGDTSTSDLNVKAIHAGIQLSFTPTVIDRNTVALDLDLTIQDRPVFEDYQTGGVTVQRVKSYRARAISVPLILGVGDVAVLNGLDDSITDSRQTGTGTADTWLLGGTSKGSNSEATHVILVSVALPPAPPLRIADLVAGEWQ